MNSQMFWSRQAKNTPLIHKYSSIISLHEREGQQLTHNDGDECSNTTIAEEEDEEEAAVLLHPHRPATKSAGSAAIRCPGCTHCQGCSDVHAMRLLVVPRRLVETPASHRTVPLLPVPA